MVNVSVTKDTGGYNIRVGGTTLVSGEEVAPDTTAAAIEQEYSSGTLKGGEIVGLFVLRDNCRGLQKPIECNGRYTCKQVRWGYDTCRSTYNGVNLTADQTVTVKGINGLHKLGYLFSQPPNTPQQAGDFFSSAGVLYHRSQRIVFVLALRSITTRCKLLPLCEL